jgi:hypothetical protein
LLLVALLIGRESISQAVRRRTATERRRSALAPLRELKAVIIGRRGESRVAAVLALLGVPALHNVVLEDWRGRTQIDHIALTRHGFVVLETKTYSGTVAGAVGGAEWVQTVGGRKDRNRFQNPHRQNYRHVKAVELAVGDRRIPVRGYVVTAGAALFVGDLAASVVPLDRLGEIFRRPDEPGIDPATLAAAWSRIIRAAGRPTPGNAHDGPRLQRSDSASETGIEL